MTFRVIEGGGRAALPAVGTAEEARAAIIDRVAAAIWSRQDEHPDPAFATWEEMKALVTDDPVRASYIRVTLAQARAAVAALKPQGPPDAEWRLLGQRGGLTPEEFADNLTAFGDCIDAVLS